MRGINFLSILLSKTCRISFFAIAAGMFLLNACVSQQTGFDDTAFRQSRPRSILVMPPINMSNDMGAPATFLATSVMPLAESGYYVIPVALSELTFRLNGVTVAEEAHAISPLRLREIFGADAALYITITHYGVTYILVNSVVKASASARLVDLRTGQELWKGDVSVDLSNNYNSNSLLALIVVAAVDQVVNTVTDKAYDAGKQANAKLLSAGNYNGLLYGPYHELYESD
ncbi:MAG: DUF799 domain-containing protein [Treponema sp.]|jgi:hypothetical protein|nr:DUF799 domain-containing protein [Treponema sp.]